MSEEARAWERCARQPGERILLSETEVWIALTGVVHAACAAVSHWWVFGSAREQELGFVQVRVSVQSCRMYSWKVVWVRV